MTETQGPLFSDGAAGDSGLFADVVFRRQADRAFTYAVPLELAEAAAIGKRVVAPFGPGNQRAIGYVVHLSRQRPQRRVKLLARILDDHPLLTPGLLRLIRWMSDYYLCSLGRTLDAVVPAAVKSRAGSRDRQLIEAVALEDLPLPPPKLTHKQSKALELLRSAARPQPPAALAEAAGVGLAVVRALVDKGFARFTIERRERTPVVESLDYQTPQFPLNPDQSGALAAVERALAVGGYRAFLLHGVTGSGKTEIYLQAIDRVVAQGKQAIVLVPEISLTPQMIQRFRGRFARVAVLHSHLSDAERGSHWRHIAAGRVQVVVGARSAVFAPTPQLGLIVVDEEHEGSFKQESPAPRYHARDVAVMRASLESAPIILGSATPSLESWHNAQVGKYVLLTLPQRVLDRPLPRVALIDMRHERLPPGRFRAISPSLERTMREALAAGGQVILLLNRRGHDTQLLCPSCGHVVQCRNCEVALTHHRDREAALCHYCGYEQPPPVRCPECGLAQVRFLGVGTEKLEAEIAHKFPGVEARRMDSDSMRRRGTHVEVLDAFRRGDVRILFGTQMIAKGLDFPRVTLVGVVNADTALYLPDFRSAERTFQLLAQVAGRTGRGEAGGRVLVQTYNPEHPCIALAAQHNYRRFAEVELEQRRQHGYPPFCRLARIVIRSKDQAAAADFAEHLAEVFRRQLQRPADTGAAAPVRVLGPAEAPLYRLRGYYRFHFQLQAADSETLHVLLRRVLAGGKPPENVRLAVDVDPLAML